MVDPTQNDENKKPSGSEGAAKPEPQGASEASAKQLMPRQSGATTKEEVSAADLLSLWGGGASSSASAKPETKPELKLESKPEPKLEDPEPSSAPTPISKPAPKPVTKIEEPKPPAPAPKPELKSQPTPSPAPALEPVKKLIQPETAFWEAAAPAAPKMHEEEPISFQPQKQAAPKPKVKIEPEIFPPDRPSRSEATELMPRQGGATLEEISPPKEILKEKSPPEIVEGEVIKSEPLPEIKEPEALEEEETFSSQIDEFLAELNLSRKHIFYGIGCLILIIVLVFGGILGYKFYKNRKPSLPDQPVITDTSTGVTSASQVGEKFDPSLVGDTGIISTISIGVELSGATEIANYIMIFRRLQNAYETDINELLNQSTDRRGRLNSHLALLNKLYSDGSLVSANLKLQMDQLKAQYEEKKKQQQTYDVNFFEQMKAFNPQTTENILADFIAVSQEIVSLRARFKSLQKINSYYQYALPKLNARIKDIELNAQPLILSLKVYDVKGSDVKLIVPVEGGSNGSEKTDSLETVPGFPLMINPASVDTGHDYITKPGGGF